MNQRERNFWNWLDTQMCRYWHSQRHEDKYSTGIPDVSFALNGIDGWIELKAYEKWPNGKLPHYTKDQANWLYSRRERGSGHIFILMKIEKTVLLFGAFIAYELLKPMNEESLRYWATKYWDGKFDVKEFIEVITK